MEIQNKVKAVCPLCGWVSNVSKHLIGNKWGIDDVKCTPCFHDRSIFVNLQLTEFEKQRKP